MMRAFMLSTVLCAIFHILFFANPTICTSWLWITLIISFFNLCKEYAKFDFENSEKTNKKTLADKDQIIKTLKADLIKENIRVFYFSMLYASESNNAKMFEKAKSQLLNLGIDETLINDQKKFTKFVEKLYSKKIEIEYSDDNTFIFKNK